MPRQEFGQGIESGDDNGRIVLSHPSRFPVLSRFPASLAVFSCIPSGFQHENTADLETEEAKYT